MKKKRYDAKQIVRIVQEAERGEITIGEPCRRYEVSEATFYRWRKVYGNLKVAEVKRLRTLEQEMAASSVSWLSETWRLMP